jgi:hypothetical protein
MPFSCLGATLAFGTFSAIHGYLESTEEERKDKIKIEYLEKRIAYLEAELEARDKENQELSQASEDEEPKEPEEEYDYAEELMNAVRKFNRERVEFLHREESI